MTGLQLLTVLTECLLKIRRLKTVKVSDFLTLTMLDNIRHQILFVKVIWIFSG